MPAPCLPENTILLENEGKDCLGPPDTRLWMECGINNPFTTRRDLACSPLAPSAGLDISGQPCDKLHEITLNLTQSAWLEKYSPIFFSQSHYSVQFVRRQLQQISCQSRREVLLLVKTSRLTAQTSSLMLSLTLFFIINLSLRGIEVTIRGQLLLDFPKHSGE